ncbi:hypothetical protein TIFTF001_002349 [Ficus carica]|uniref:Uncharacterized protein n=1 Tax=Ficus carica TaxID=3494 RepID=A0AA87ZCS8_FICCA|nr:hypothetical protein TIFTF001_002349 [Ficus carica]
MASLTTDVLSKLLVNTDSKRRLMDLGKGKMGKWEWEVELGFWSDEETEEGGTLGRKFVIVVWPLEERIVEVKLRTI